MKKPTVLSLKESVMSIGRRALVWITPSLSKKNFKMSDIGGAGSQAIPYMINGGTMTFSDCVIKVCGTTFTPCTGTILYSQFHLYGLTSAQRIAVSLRKEFDNE